MKADLKKIKEFYDTDMGQYAHGVISKLMAKYIKDKKTSCVTSQGGYLYEDFLREHFEMLSSHTPKNQPDDIYSLCWPETTQSVNHVVMIHDIEFSKNPENHIAEAWRVLKGDGRFLVIFPNRAGRWAQNDNTPFGVGTPSTIRQMKKMIEDKRFIVETIEGALYYPPREPKLKFIRNIFEMSLGFMGCYPSGIILMEAKKQEPSMIKNSVVVRASETVRGALTPNPAPSSSTSAKTK